LVITGSPLLRFLYLVTNAASPQASNRSNEAWSLASFEPRMRQVRAGKEAGC
jgi:hypothetical protein